jgi:hypothetical protein
MVQTENRELTKRHNPCCAHSSWLDNILPGQTELQILKGEVPVYKIRNSKIESKAEKGTNRKNKDVNAMGGLRRLGRIRRSAGYGFRTFRMV